MAKANEKKIARELYIQQAKPAKEIADLLNVTEKTIGRWVEQGNWKSSRAAKATNQEQRVENIYAIIDNLAAEHIELNHQIAQLALKNTPEAIADISKLRQNKERTSMSVAYWNNALDKLQKANQINQLLFIQIAEIIFRHFDSMYPQIMTQSVEFQQHLLQNIIPTYAKN